MATSITTRKEALQSIPFAQRSIVILGAGIIGCAAARQLLQCGFQVTLVAEYLPGDISIFYSSAWAGAIWYPAENATDDQKTFRATTHRHLLRMGRKAGVCAVKTREYYENAPPKDLVRWGPSVVTNFKELAPGEYPSNFEHAVTFDALVTDPTIHMKYIRSQVESLGGQFVRQKVKALSDLYELFPSTSVFINASGSGSKYLRDVLDQQSFFERGQNIFYKTTKTDTIYIRNGHEETYIIPRPIEGGVILGGVRQRDNYSPFVDPEIVRDELERAHRLAPEVVPANPSESDITVIIGMRPSRSGGYRLESEKVGDRTILSAYGFAGSGFSLSYGIAEALVKMVKQAERDEIIPPRAKL